jgi:regulator of replication initiation timing
MVETTLPQIEELVSKLIAQNAELKQQVSELAAEKQRLIDENETLQLEAIEVEEKQQHTEQTLSSLLSKLQQVSA